MFGGAGFVDACTVSGLSVSGVGVMDITAAKDEDGGGGHETWGINSRGVCVEDVGQRRVESGWQGKENRGGGKRGRWSGGEGEQAKQRGGDPKSVVMPVECSWDHVICNVPKNDLLSLLHQN